MLALSRYLLNSSRSSASCFKLSRLMSVQSNPAPDASSSTQSSFQYKILNTMVDKSVKDAIRDPHKLQFEPVFDFPYIRAAGLVTRFKLYQTCLVSLLVVPEILRQSVDGLLPPSQAVVGMTLGFTSIALLGLIGEYSRHIVGRIQYRPCDQIVWISHLSFFGRRQDKKYHVSEIKLMSDVPDDPKSLIWRIHFEDESVDPKWPIFKKNPKLYVCTRFGGVRSVEHMKTIFSGDNHKILEK